MDDLLAHLSDDERAVLTRALVRYDTDLRTILREAVDRHVTIGRKHEYRLSLAYDKQLHRRVWRLAREQAVLTRTWLSVQVLDGARIGVEAAKACLERYEADEWVKRSRRELGQEDSFVIVNLASDRGSLKIVY